MHKLAIYCLIVLAGAATIIGCSSDTPKATAQEQKDFKGGPMPPDVRKKFMESMQANQQHMQDAAANGRNAAVSGGGVRETQSRQGGRD